MRALVIAATASGVGKTTCALGLVAALRRRGLRVAPFKVGPAFPDPQYLARAAGRPCHTLDGYLMDEAGNRAALARAGADGADFAIVEGMMGLYDGIDGRTDAGSTAALARSL